jgi:G3E family GTPase
MHGPARAAVVDRLLRENPGARAIHHDLREIAADLVLRVVRDADLVHEHTLIRLAHGCISCTVREDLLPELLRQAASEPSLLIVELWDSVEPRSVVEAIAVGSAGELRITAVLAALDPELTPVDLCRDEALSEVGKVGSRGDRRHFAEVLARQIEYATALVLPEVLPYPLPPVEQESLALCRDVLGHLAPLTPVHLPDDSLPRLTGAALCVTELAARVDPATAQFPGESATTAATTVVWRRSGPLHPNRFFDVVDELAAGTVRSRGRFWVDNRPNRMLAWEAAAGVVTVADAGPWLASLPDTAWESLPPVRRAAAALDWSPEHGDRVQHLVFTGPDLDRDQLHALLDACLLTPAELTTPWRVDSDDPFARLLDQETA